MQEHSKGSEKDSSNKKKDGHSGRP